MIQATFTPTNKNKIGQLGYKTSIEGLFYLPHKMFADERGFYSEVSRIPEVETITKQKFVIKQLNQSRSKTNVIRGIHAENWNKLVTVTSGLCYCVLVDLRPNSATFAKYESFYLGTDKQALKGSIYISKGIGNSLCAIKGPVDYVYAVDALWSKRNVKKDRAINLFDPTINIKWPIDKQKMIVSKRDQQGISLKKMFPDKF